MGGSSTLGRRREVLEIATLIELTRKRDEALSILLSAHNELLSRNGYLNLPSPNYVTPLERRPLRGKPQSGSEESCQSSKKGAVGRECSMLLLEYPLYRFGSLV